jgi:hypothetical protein
LLPDFARSHGQLHHPQEGLLKEVGGLKAATTSKTDRLMTEAPYF